jgi:hypothetical protein
MGTTTVFFSWQLDRPSSDCRNFIDKALETAVRNISRDIAVDEPPRDIQVDKDTKNVAGSPPIFETILEKIERAAVFVPDLTFVGTRANGDPTPNPNVLIEYGYALKAVASARIVGVMNGFYGRPTRQSLPFDLADYRFPITYNLAPDASEPERKSERDKLAKALELAIRMVLESDAYLSTLPKPPAPPVALYRDPAFGRSRFRHPNEPIGVHVSALTKFTGQGQPQKITLADGPPMWLRVAPKHQLSSFLKVTDLESGITKLATLPLYGGGGQSSSVRNNDGFGLCAVFPNHPAVSVVYVFTDGEIWAIDTFSSQSLPDVIPLDESMFVNSLQQCADFLRELNINGPYRWIAGFEGVNARFIDRPNDPMRRKAGPCMADVIEREGTFKTGDNPTSALELFFADIYDQCGLRRPTPKLIGLE